MKKKNLKKLNNLMLIVLSFALLHCEEVSLTKEQVETYLPSIDTFVLQTSDIVQSIKDASALCGLPDPTTEVLDPAISPEEVKATLESIKGTIRFKDDKSYEMTLSNGTETLIEKGTWQLIDENTLDLTDEQGNTSRMDIQLGGTFLYFTVNTEEEGKELNCSSPQGSISSGIPGVPQVSPDFTPPPPPLSATAEALQGTWCYYKGIPYYVGVQIAAENVSVAYIFDQTIAADKTIGSLAFRHISATIDDASRSASVSLITDANISLEGIDNPAKLLFNGTTNQYIKIRYASGKLGFFKKSDTEQCPVLDVSGSGL